jgi:hypothetical protein
VLALWVAEPFDVYEHVPSGGVPFEIASALNPLSHQQLEEALRDGVVGIVAASARARIQIVVAHE